MNESAYFGTHDDIKPSGYIKASIIEDWVCGDISTTNLGKRYMLSERVILQLIAEVLPDDPTGKTKTVVFKSSV